MVRLVSKNAVEFNIIAEEALKACYNVQKNEELEKILNQLLILEHDSMKDKRIQVSEQFRQKATENIINDLLAQV